MDSTEEIILNDLSYLENKELTSEDWEMDVESFFGRGCDINYN